MSKRAAADRGERRANTRRKPIGIVAALLLVLAASGATLSRMGVLPGSRSPAGVAGPAVPEPSSLGHAKEYIYAGGRLVAVEEAAPPPPPPSPAVSGLLASAYPASPTTVTVTWAAIAGVDHYEVERKVSLTDPNPYSFNCAASPCNDPSAAPAKAYIYRVRAVYANGSASGYSNTDLATTFQFSNDPLNPSGQKTTIRASHFTELRDAVNAVRVAAGLPAFSWTAPLPQTGGVIRASHFNDLRTKLGEALSQLNLPQPQSAPASAGGTVTYAPVQELRDLMR